MVEKIKGRDGKLAPSVTRLVREKGLAPELRKKLLRLRGDVIKHHVIFTDVSGNNIVVARGKRGRDRLVIIDGLGDRLWLPVNVLSARINRLNRIRHFGRAIAKLERIDRQRPSRVKSRAKSRKSR